MEQPTQIPIALKDAEARAKQREAVAAALGEPPGDWDRWTQEAEDGILEGLQVKRVGSTYRGGPVRYKAQTISRVQDGKYGLGTNQA